ncbi:HIT family protein [Pararhizobium mangrovi]|uniref:HIT family protein n=1 Tax=Pararhizobium mangrovi TaxID=2590452 RepID=A0A506U936_9HYPH|nr:HIT family protein [Pararhizobium mangrovi]TPW28357.1 HIT family protein [Pararhizobium mangrovi]
MSDDFILDTRLAGDTFPIKGLGLSAVRLMDDARWPWLVLVPQRAGIGELFELPPLDQTSLTYEIAAVSAALKRLTACTKINVGALGNVVRQLHVHVVARNEGDPAWPGPVWGVGTARRYDDEARRALIAALRDAL